MTFSLRFALVFIVSVCCLNVSIGSGVPEMCGVEVDEEGCAVKGD